MPHLLRLVFLPLAITTILSAGCATTSTSRTDANHEQADASFGNFLVIGVAVDYNARAQFERSVVSGIKAKGASAGAYHVAAGGNKPLTRETVRDAVARGAFDAVVVTRVLNTESAATVKNTVTGTKVTRKDGGVLDLFRYDYEELDEPISLTVDMKITFSTELYNAADESLVWSAESTGPRGDNLGELIDNMAEAVVREIDRADKIAR